MNSLCRNAVLGFSILTLIGATGCTRSPEQKQAAYLERGKVRMQSHDYERAILEFRNSIQINPKIAEPHYQLALACLAAGRLQEGVDELGKTTMLDPKHASAQLKLAELMVLSGKSELLPEASEKAQAVLNDRPGDADALFVLAALQFQAGNRQQGQAMLQQALSKAPDQLKSSVALASAKLAQNDAKGAENALLNAVRAAPKSPDALSVLGGFYRSTGRIPEAEARFQEALKIDPANALALTEAAALQMQQGKLQAAEETYRTISKLPGDEYQAALGIYFLQQNKLDAAISEFSRIYKKNPEDRANRSRLVATYLIANRVSDAESVLQKAIKKNSKDTDALLQRSRIYLMQGRANEAETDLNLAIRNKFDSAEAHYLLAGVHAARRNVLQQRQELAQAIQISPDFVAARIDLANILTRTADPKSALDILDAAPGRQTYLADVKIARNWALISRGDAASARKGVDEVLAAVKAPDALIQDAMLRLAARDYPGALSQVEQMLAQNPVDIRALRALGQIYDSQRQPDKATEKIRSYVAQRPNSAEAQSYLATRLLRSGQRADARFALLAAKGADPNASGPTLMLARLDAEDGKLDLARQSASAVLQSDPQSASAWMILGMVEEDSDHIPQAIDAYRKVLLKEPAHSLALNNLAFCLSRTSGGLDEALQYGQKAKEVAPESAAVADTLGWIYYQKQLYPSALRELQAAANAVDAPMVKLHLGLTYVQLGDKKRGVGLLEAAVKASPELRAQVPQSILEAMR